MPKKLPNQSTPMMWILVEKEHAPDPEQASPTWVALVLPPRQLIVGDQIMMAPIDGADPAFSALIREVTLDKGKTYHLTAMIYDDDLRGKRPIKLVVQRDWSWLGQAKHFWYTVRHGHLVPSQT